MFFRSLHITVFVTSLVMTMTYASYVAGGGQDLGYRNARYGMPFYPYWTVLAVIAAVGGFRWMTAASRGRPKVAGPGGETQVGGEPVNSSTRQVPASAPTG